MIINILQMPAGLVSKTLCAALVVDKAPLSLLVSKIQICVPSPWIFTWNKGALQKLETNFYFKDLHRVFSLQLSGICMWSWIWNFHSLSWSESDMEYQTVSWKFNVRMGSCYVKTIISLSCSPAILTEPQAREGKLEKFVGESWNIKTMYSFYLNAHKTTSPRVKHFMRVELSLS